MKERPYQLDAGARTIVLQAIREVCIHRNWLLDACHVRTTHVHIVVTSDADVDKMMTDFKAYSSRTLNRFGEKRNKRWARHGSTKRITDREKVIRAIRYVIEGQGQPMAVWPEPRSFNPPH